MVGGAYLAGKDNTGCLSFGQGPTAEMLYLAGLTELQRTIVIAGGVVGLWGVLWSYVRYGTDFSGVGDWLRSWFS